MPFTPKFDGIDEFQGRHMHSHDYRRADAFKGSNRSHCHKSLLSDNHKFNKSKSINEFSGFADKSVLIIGGGPSGIDLVYSISEFAKTVISSHHTHNSTYTFANNVIRMGSVQKFTKNGVTFTDGTEVEIDVVIFCTGIILILNSWNWIKSPYFGDSRTTSSS